LDSEHEPAQPPPAVPAPEPATEPAPEPAHEPEPHDEPSAVGGVKLYAKILALLFVIGYSVAFILDNDKAISIDFVFATARVSLIWSILLLLAVGVAGGVLLSQLYRHRRSKQSGKP
jgi:uncharacterized integral membrane protein